ncbi:HNH endonuclease family protein [Streptomyces sp. NPDC090231]|uniref:HNH endonuclease family protein n=1 Tax=unclassified Streptomyces TaxID=2593676 RepID=UPI003807B151
MGRRESTLLEENIFGVAKDLTAGAQIGSATRQICDWIPDDEAFHADFREASTPKSSQSRYLLGKIEASLRSAAGVDEVVVANSSIVHVEHIYPQKPSSEWRLDEHDTWVNRIGNLTLLLIRNALGSRSLTVRE